MSKDKWDRIGGTMRKLGGKEGPPSHLGSSLGGKTGEGDIRLFSTPKPSPERKAGTPEAAKEEMKSFIEYLTELLKDAQLLDFYRRNNSPQILLAALQRKCELERLPLSVRWGASEVSFAYNYQNSLYTHSITMDLFQRFLENFIEKKEKI